MIVALWPKGGLAPRALITMMRCPFGTNRPWYRHRRAPCGYRTEEQELHLHSQGRYLGFDGSFVNKNEPLFVVFPADYFGVGQKRVHFGKLVFVDHFVRSIQRAIHRRWGVPAPMLGKFKWQELINGELCTISRWLQVIDVISTRRGVWVTAALRLQRFFRRRMYERKRWPLVVADAMEIAKCYARGAGRFVRRSEIEASWLESMMIRDCLWKGSANRQAHLTKEMTRRRRVKERTPEQQLPEQQLQGNYARVMAT